MGGTVLESAVRLRHRLGGPVFEPSVQAWLDGRGGFPRLLVACSGGVDSTALLLLFADRYADASGALRVAHFDHRWRGAESEEDAEWVEQLATGLGLSCVVGRCPEGADASTETAARALRIDFLRNAATEFGAEAIAFGHQQEDILETQLLRLARGSGTEGLSAPRPVQPFESGAVHLRPLLHRKTGDLRSALEESGFAWREDHTNTNTSIPRNAMRHEVVPRLRVSLDRDPSSGAARSRKLLQEDADALAVLAREAFPEAFGGAASLDRLRLRVLHRALLRRVLLGWLGSNGLVERLSAAGFDSLLDSVISGETTRISAGEGFILMDDRHLVIERGEALPDDPPGPGILRAGNRMLFADGTELAAEALVLDGSMRSRILSGEVDCSTMAFLAMPDAEESFVVRGWREGDRFRPIGSPGNRKLQDWFTDRRVPVRDRRRLPIILDESGRVLWVPGFAPADGRKVGEGTKTALRLTYQCANPR